jgi:hypothetical protein
MTAVLSREEAPTTDTDMAKAPPADPVLVACHSEALCAAAGDREAFEAAFSALKIDHKLRVNDVIAIAVAYRGGGVRPRSKAQALEMIEKRFVEIVRDAKKNAAAARMRPW